MSSFARRRFAPTHSLANLIKEREGWWNDAGAREFEDISSSEVWNGDQEKRRDDVNNNFARAARVDRFRERNT